MRLIIAVVFALLPAAAWADCNRYVHEFHDEWMLIDEGIQIIEYNRSVYGTIYDTGGAGTGLPFRAALPFQADDEEPALYRYANIDGREAIIWNMMFFYKDCTGWPD